MLANRGIVEINRITGVPFPVPVFEFELHEVSSNGGEWHLTLLSVNGVDELEDFVVPGTPLSHPQPLASRQYTRHCFRHWRFLRHVQYLYHPSSPTTAGHFFNSKRLLIGFCFMYFNFGARTIFCVSRARLLVGAYYYDANWRAVRADSQDNFNAASLFNIFQEPIK